MKKQWNETTKKVRKSDMITIGDSKTKIVLESVGKFVQVGSFIHPDRILDSYEFILVEDGILYIAEEDHSYSVESNQFLLLQPGKNHYGTKEMEGRLSFYWVHFIIENEDSLLPPIKYGTLENPYVIANLLKQMLHSFCSLDYPACYGELLLSQMLMEVRRMQENLSKSYRPILKEIGEWIRIHAEEKISLQLVSEVFQYNSDYLTKIFMDTFQISIKDYIIQQKLIRAKYYLLHTNYTMKQIASMLHFEESNTFIKYFKYHEKITPSKYRNLYFNTHLNQK